MLVMGPALFVVTGRLAPSSLLHARPRYLLLNRFINQKTHSFENVYYQQLCWRTHTRWRVHPVHSPLERSCMNITCRPVGGLGIMYPIRHTCS